MYCRVASESKFTMYCQKEHLTKCVLSLGYSDPAYYEDNGASGLSFDRPGFRQMEVDIQAEKISAVIVSNIPRIGRDTDQAVRWIDNIIDSGIKFISAMEPYERFPDLETLHRAYKSKAHAAKSKPPVQLVVLITD